MSAAPPYRHVAPQARGRRRSWRAEAGRLPLDHSWDLLTVCLAVYLACAVGRVHQLFPFLAPLHPTLLSAVLALGLYVVSQDGPRDIGRVWCGPAIALLAFLIWAGLSVPGALHDGLALNLVLDPLAKSIVLGLLLAGVVRGLRDVERLAGAYFLSAALFAVVMLTRFGATLESAPWGEFYYDANDFATFAVTALPLGGYFIFSRRAVIQRVAALAGVVALAVGLVWSGSRGGFLALVAAALCGAVVYRSIPVRWRLGAPIAVALVVGAAAGPQYFARMQTGLRPGSDYNWTSESGRIQVWKRGLSYALNRPVFGVGAGNFPIAEGMISPLADRQFYGVGVKWSAAHNSFLQVAAEVGIPGLVLYLCMFVLLFTTLRRIAARPPPADEDPEPDSALLAQALLVSFTGFLMGAFFLSLAYAPMLYAMIGLTLGLRKAVVDATARSVSHTPHL